MAQQSTDKLKKTSKVSVGNEKLPSQVSLSRVIEVSKLLAKGKSRQYVLDYVVKNFEVGVAQAKRYYTAAVNYLVPEDMEEYRKGLIQQNVERLETIVEKAMEEGDWKNARETIAEINKMCGLTGSGVQFAINTDKENNSQQILIKFD